jgi:hypothetical protein
MLVILSEAKDLLFVGAVGEPATIGQTLVLFAVTLKP